MSNALRPTAEFDWTAVSWGGPDEVVAGACSYCTAPLSEEASMPLILWAKDGWCARFCAKCQKRYWGMESAEECDDEP